MPHIIFVPSTNSTNSLIAAMDAESPLPDNTVVAAHTQLAGRGQRGNSWESAPGENLTFSMLLRPRIHPAQQFAVSEAVALAVADSLKEISGCQFSVKWPNDIYYQDLKIAGILIENSITGMSINRSIAGIGVNINQVLFTSPAPNPVSLAQITGKSYALPPILASIACAITHNLTLLHSPELHSRYIDSLWRREGYHPYIVAESNEKIMARIVDVLPSGHILMERRGAVTPAMYAFKEISAVI